MKHSRHADHSCCLTNHPTHSICRFINVTYNFWKRSIITNGSSKNNRYFIFYTAADDSIIQIVLFNKLRNGATSAYFIANIQMIIMSVRQRSLCINVLTKCCMKKCAFQVMCSKGISCHNSLCIAIFDQKLHRSSCICIKSKCRSHDPDNISMFFFIFQKLKQLIVIACVRSFTASSLTEHKLIFQSMLFICKTITVHINTIFTFFCSSQDHLIPFFNISCFHNIQSSVFAQNNAGIHAALLCQFPLTINLKIFRIHRGTMIIFRCYTILFCFFINCIRRFYKLFFLKIRMMIFRHFK